MQHVSKPGHPEDAPIQIGRVVFPRIRHLLGDPAFYNSGFYGEMLLTTICRNDDKNLVSSAIFHNLEGSCTVHGRSIRSGESSLCSESTFPVLSFSDPVWGYWVEWGHHMSFRMELQCSERLLFPMSSWRVHDRYDNHFQRWWRVNFIHHRHTNDICFGRVSHFSTRLLVHPRSRGSPLFLVLPVTQAQFSIGSPQLPQIPAIRDHQYGIDCCPWGTR